MILHMEDFEGTVFITIKKYQCPSLCLCVDEHGSVYLDEFNYDSSSFWIQKSYDDENGWFWLENRKYKGVLTASSFTKTIIAGEIFFQDYVHCVAYYYAGVIWTGN